ncbi:MAG TPA: hypothetical protein VMV18_07645, partial [bacterium]|nr:hypothetical protein [bacterium]
MSALNELAGSEGARAALEAAAAARHVLLSKGDYDGAELLFQRELALAPDAPTRAEVLAEMARYYRDFLRDKARAIDCFVNAFELDTTRMDLLEEVGAVYHQKESFDDLVGRLKEEAANARDPAQQSRWLAEMADVLLKMLDQPERALAAAYDAIRADAMNLRARGIAEAVLIQSSRWPELATFYKRSARDTRDLNDRVALLFRLASTWRDKLRDPLQTMETYEEIVAAAPNNIRIYALIDELKGDRETWQRVGAQLVLLAKSAKDKDDAALNWALAGKVYLKYLADDATAADCYLALVKTDPMMPGALKALRDLATRRNDPRLLARALTDAAKGTPDPNRRRDLHRELGTIYRGALAAPSLAAEAFAAALAIDPNDANAAEQLEALYAELGEWEPLAEHLKKRIASAPADRAPGLLARLGEVLAERMGQPAAAVEAYEDALGREPAHRPSLLALERLYRASKQWSEVARVYRGLAQSAPDEAEAIRAHKALAGVLLEQLHDVSGGAAELETALRLDRGDRETWEALETAYNAGERWNDLLRLYAEVPTGDDFKDLARSWYRKAAELCARRLSDPAQAALWYRRARLLDPSDAALRDALAA